INSSKSCGAAPKFQPRNLKKTAIMESAMIFAVGRMDFRRQLEPFGLFVDKVSTPSWFCWEDAACVCFVKPARLRTLNLKKYM
ncbi:MAG: hypothetical protein AB7F32_12210, partial [Victivallaceae bacterium]